jgi:hypothetical protein
MFRPLSLAGLRGLSALRGAAACYSSRLGPDPSGDLRRQVGTTAAII